LECALETPNEHGGQVARVFKFVDIWGYVLRTISDPKDNLPIPTSTQTISMGRNRMFVESVTVLSTNIDTPIVYGVCVHVPDAIDQLFDRRAKAVKKSRRSPVRPHEKVETSAKKMEIPFAGDPS